MTWESLIKRFRQVIDSDPSVNPASMLTVIKEDRFGEKGIKDENHYPADTEILIFYGSQFGEMRTAATKFAEACKTINFHVKLINLQFFKPKMLRFDKQRTIVVIITSTYGNGGPPDNAQFFYNWLKHESTRFHATKVRPLPSSEIVAKPSLKKNLYRMIGLEKQSVVKGVHYCVFGGGSSFYDHFCGMAKFVDTTFESLGGIRIHTPAFGDAAKKNTDAVFKEWNTSLIKYLTEHILSEAPDPKQLAGVPNPILSIETLYFSCKTLPDGPQEFNDPIRCTWGNPIPQNQHFFECMIMQVTRIEPAFSEVQEKEKLPGALYIRLTPDSPNTTLNYQAAGIVSLLVSNESKLVERMAKLLSLNLEDHIQIIPFSPVSAIPFPITSSYTIRQILTSYVDLASVSQNVLEHLIHYATDKNDIDELERLSSVQGRTAYESTFLKLKKTLPDVLRDFSSIDITFQQLLHICDYLRPRFFTIASSPIVLPNAIDLTVACPWLDSYSITQSFAMSPLMVWMKRLYMEKIVNPNQILRIRANIMSSSNFNLPSNQADTIICIAMGSGISPMRALLQERILSPSNGSNILFYGCRTSNSILYESELTEWEISEKLAFFPVFSRNSTITPENNQDQLNRYVQDILPDYKNMLLTHLRQHNAHVYVCGKNAFLKSIKKVFETILQEMHFAKDANTSLVDQLIQSKRYHQEGWG